MKRLLTLLSLLPACALAANTGMVVSEQHLAAEVGASILKSGGNAIDAAVAVGYALAVVNPCCGNIGGGGFMTIHLANGKNVFINFREKAPDKATQSMPRAINGYIAVAVPGTVLGFETALKRYGTMSRNQVMAPAIKLANKGYKVTTTDAWQFAKYADDFQKQAPVAAIFLQKGKPYQAGDLLVQKNLGYTLSQIAAKGPDVFYKGWIAKSIVDASQAQGGILSMKDFAEYTVEELVPIECEYRGYGIVSAPPPSSGGVALCESLNILENFPLAQLGRHSLLAQRYILEAMRYAFVDRNNLLGDPDFIHNPVSQLLSKSYAHELSQHIASTKWSPLTTESTAKHGLTDTTHYSVVDRHGNAVAVTYTLNSFFGAGVIAPNTGFFLNDEMDDFSASDNSANQFNLLEGAKNAIAPDKRPLSSMTPTIVLKNGSVAMVLGSPGGPRIITTTLLTLLNVIDFDMALQAAVDAPRFHFQSYPNEVYMEPLAFSFMEREGLRYLGYRLVTQSTWGAVEAIQILPDGQSIGANDARRPAGSVARD